MGNSYKVPADSRANPWPRYANGKQVFKLPEACGWMVSSSRLDRGFWHIQGGYDEKVGWWFRCGCDYGARHDRMGSHATLPAVCVHVRAANAAESDHGFAPRPEGKVNPSVFVD